MPIRGEGMGITLAEVLLSIFMSTVFYILLREMIHAFKDQDKGIDS
ncbi:hypothetical protein [Paenibacillus sp. N3.4]|nr:hypothetical protein [Paenibacillus sp. N3.4]